MATHPFIMGIGWDSSDHIGGIDIFESNLKIFFFAVRNNFIFQESSDILYINKYLLLA
jgi:hypothetical protein